MRRAERLNYFIRDILFREWDPIGINSDEFISDEYDSYVSMISQLLDSDVDSHKLANHLSHLRRVAMGMSHEDKDWDFHIAQRLIASSRLASKSCPVQSVDELIERYAQGYRDFTGSDVNFSFSASCDGKRLDGAIFDDSWFSGSFVGASLRGCSFRHAHVKSSDFSHADLRGADFCGAALCGTTFKGAKTDGMKIEGAYYHDADFKRGDVPNW